MAEVGCIGLLAVPLSTVAIGFRCLISPTAPGSAQPPTGRYRAAAPDEDARRPLTPGATRFVGALLLFWTLLAPLGFAGRGVFVYRESPAGIVLTIAMAWVVMFIGHLIAIKLVMWIQPRLPHVEPSGDEAARR